MSQTHSQPRSTLPQNFLMILSFLVCIFTNSISWAQTPPPPTNILVSYSERGSSGVPQLKVRQGTVPGGFGPSLILYSAGPQDSIFVWQNYDQDIDPDNVYIDYLVYRAQNYSYEFRQDKVHLPTFTFTNQASQGFGRGSFELETASGRINGTRVTFYAVMYRDYLNPTYGGIIIQTIPPIAGPYTIPNLIRPSNLQIRPENDSQGNTTKLRLYFGHYSWPTTIPYGSVSLHTAEINLSTNQVSLPQNLSPNIDLNTLQVGEKYFIFRSSYSSPQSHYMSYSLTPGSWSSPVPVFSPAPVAAALLKEEGDIAINLIKTGQNIIHEQILFAAQFYRSNQYQLPVTSIYGRPILPKKLPRVGGNIRNLYVFGVIANGQNGLIPNIYRVIDGVLDQQSVAITSGSTLNAIYDFKLDVLP